MTERPAITAVAFDLGGVLLELNDPVETFGLDCDLSEFNRRWLLSPSVQRFERGRIDADTFAAAIVREMALPYGPAEFIERFDAWPGDFFPYAAGILAALAPVVRTGILSNTNALHWRAFGVEAALGEHIDRYFLSFETGLAKPGRASFTQLADAWTLEPGRILFFDDNPLNVEAARAAGLNALPGRSEAEIRRGLADAGLIDD